MFYFVTVLKQQPKKEATGAIA